MMVLGGLSVSYERGTPVICVGAHVRPAAGSPRTCFSQKTLYWGTTLKIKNRTHKGSYRRPVPRILGGS